MAFAGYISEIIFDGGLDAQSYLYTLPVVQYLSAHRRLRLSSNVTFFIGENGTGKSTLLEAIAVAYGFNAEGGSIHFRFSTKTTHSVLWQHLTLGKKVYAKDGFFLRAESLYNAATYIEELDEIPASSPPILTGYGGVSLHSQSHGESFLAAVHNRFGGHGLYILDEPEAALSPMRQLSLMAEIHRLVQNDSQLLIATHSPILMAFPDADIYLLTDDGIQKTTYEQTEHYLFTKRFLENPNKILRHLFENNNE